MTRRYYQLFALAILIGAPLLVSLMVNGLATFHVVGTATPAPAGAAIQPDYTQQAPTPANDLPPAQPPPPPADAQQNGPQASAAFSAAPSMDPSGVAIAGSDPTPGMGAPSDPTANVDSRLEGDYGASGGPSEEDLIAKQSRH